MKQSLRRLSIVAFAAALIALPATAAERPNPCALADAPAHDGGIGGTGILATEGGIGGTGKTASEGGIGGTGIVGTITGFASICVNGLEIHYDGVTPMMLNGIPGDIGQLAVGQVVAVEAASSAGGLVARSIAVFYAVAGPLSRADAATGRYTVLGQEVLLAPQAIVAAESGAPLATVALKAGDWVKVSGLRLANGEVLATRLDRSRALVEGSVGRDPALPFGDRVRRLVLEGHVTQQPAAGELRLGNLAVRLDAGTRFSGGGIADLKPDTRVLVTARRGPGQALTAESVMFIRVPAAKLGAQLLAPDSRTRPRLPSSGEFGRPRLPDPADNIRPRRH